MKETSSIAEGINSIWRTAAAVALRFPTAFLLGLCNIWFIAWATQVSGDADKVPCALIYAAGLAIVASASAQLIGERANCSRKVALAMQVAALAVFGLLAWSFLGCVKFEQHFVVSYYLTLAALVCALAWLLGFSQRRENVFALVLFAGGMALAAAVCTGGGVSLVLVAVEKLFAVKIGSHAYETVWGGAFAFIGAEFFLAYATRREEFVAPKVFKVLLVYVAFPIYLALLTVLWVYFAKCAISWSLPNGQINWLVSLASAFWMFFHFALAPFRTKLTDTFRRFGAFALLPPIAMQIVALAIRINAYGLTPARYGSILFVAFGLMFAALSLIRAGRWTEHAYLVLAATAIFAAHSPWNVVDAGVAAQCRRIESFYRKAGLFKDGEIDPTGADSKLSADAKFAISEAARFLASYDMIDGHYRRMRYYWAHNVSNEDFKKKYGFARSERTAHADRTTHRFNFADSGAPFDFDGFKHVRYVEIHNAAHVKGQYGIWVVVKEGLKASENENAYIDEAVVKKISERKSHEGYGTDKGFWSIDLPGGRKLIVLSCHISYDRMANDGKIELKDFNASGYGLLLER